MLGQRGSRVVPTTVSLAPSAVEEMQTEAKRALPDETGGMLLGYVVPVSAPERIVVEAVLGPGPDAKHSSHRFEPDSDWQDERLAEVYADSRRTTTYLGDWHSHPLDVAVPSRRDRRTARRIARKKSARMPRPLMLILSSNHEGAWEFVVYRWQAGELGAVEVEARRA